MRRSWFGLAGVVAFVAILLRPSAPPTTAQGASPDTAHRSSDTTASPKVFTTRRFQTGIGLVSEFLFGVQRDTRLGAGAAPESLDVLIATVPDPFDSHLDWMYDTYIQALLRAYEAAGYLPDRFWLPGRSDSVFAKPETQLVGAGRSAAALRELLPGVILFRAADARRHQLRLLYVVGELPTAGVRSDAFRAALDERAALRQSPASFQHLALWAHGGDADTIRIVGPSFSGTAPSIRRQLEAWLTTHPGDRASVVNGSITDRQSVELLATTPKVSFKSALQPDQVLDSVFRHVVVPRLGLEPRQIALLTESGTAFGSEQSAAVGRSADSSFLTIRFPLNISSVRSEYERHPERADPSEQLLGISHTSRIPISLQDSARPAETPPQISRLSAASINQVMDEITSTLRDREIRAVGIMATDIRDKLFLAELVRARMRDAQLFTYASNGLYQRVDYAPVMRGLLVLSSYPLTFDQQLASESASGGDSQLLPFENDGEEGTFNAAVLQLGAPERLLDLQSAPGDSVARPMVWISMVSGETTFPLAMTAPRFTTRDSRLISAPALPTREQTYATTISPITFGVCVALTIVTIALVGWASRRLRPLPQPEPEPELEPLIPEVGAKPATELTPKDLARQERRASLLWLRTHYNSIEKLSLKLHERLYTWALCVAVAAMQWPLTVILLYRIKSIWRVLGLVSLLASAALLVIIIYGLYSLPASVRRTWTVGSEYAFSPHWRAVGRWRHACWIIEIAGRFMVWVAVVLFLAVVSFYVASVATLADNGPLSGLFFARAGELADGASPIVTVFIAGCGLALWCVWHLFRIRLLRHETPFAAYCRGLIDAAPELDKPGSSTSAKASFAREAEGIKKRIFLLLPNDAAWAITVLVAFLVIWLVPQFTRSVEALVVSASWWFSPATWFDWILRGSVVGAMLITIWTVYRFVAIWHGLQRFMACIGRTPLAPAFERLPGPVTRLLRPTLLSAGPGQTVPQIAQMQWQHLCQVGICLVQAPAAAQTRPPQAPISSGSSSDTSPPPSGTATASTLVPVATMQPDIHWAEPSDSPFDADPSDSTFAREPGHSPFDPRPSDSPFDPDPTAWASPPAPGGRDPQPELVRVVYERLEQIWAAEPDAAAIDAVVAGYRDHAASDDHAFRISTSSRFRREFGSAQRLWLRIAEEFMAVQVVGYIYWVMRHLRRLAIFLVAALIVTTVMIASYWFQPESLVKALLMVLLLATVGILIMVTIDMNRDALLSRIMRTEPGRIDWSFSFVLDLAIIAIVPLVVLLSAEFPTVRSVLFSWLEPVLREIGKV